MRRATLLATLGLVAGAGLAQAQDDEFTSSDGSGSVIAFGTGHGRVLAEYTAAADFAGGVTVTFRGSEAAGCAAAGVCGVSGTLAWRPRESGSLLGLDLRTPHGRRFVTSLSVGGFFAARPPGTTIVERTRPDGTTARCIDHAESASGLVQWVTRGDRLRLGLISPSGAVLGLGSRCGGPALADVMPALPTRTLARAGLAAGTIVDLRADRELSAAGFAMEVRSTFRIRLGAFERSGRQEAPAPQPTTGRPTRTLRSIAARYDVTGVSGRLVAEVRGGSGEQCAALDSCGAAGTVTVTPSGDGDGYFSATSQRDGTTFGDLRRALRFNPFGPEPRGVQTFGFVTFGGSRAVSSLRRADGSTCGDELELEQLQQLAVIARRDGPLLRLRLVGYGSNPLGTRCPGPLAGTHTLARGLVSRSALHAREVTLSLGGERAFADDGWRVRTYSTLVLRLRRTSVSRDAYSLG